MNKDLLMTYEDYKKGEWEVPYCYTINGSGEKCLYYFGSRHSYDLTDPQFNKLKVFFEEFVSKTEGKERIVLTEGGIRPITDSEENSITKYGEMGYITYLSNESKIEVYSPEPPRLFMYQELLKSFSREEIQYYFFASMVPQYIRMADKPSFEEYIQNSLDWDKSKSGWNDFDFSLEHMKAIHKKIFNNPFDTNDAQFSKKVINPTISYSVINEVARFSSKSRDEYILEEIDKYWKEGKSVFIIYGSTHAVIQEPVLRTLAD